METTLDIAFRNFVNSVDDTGCSDGLIVANGDLLEKLSEAIADHVAKTKALFEAADSCLANACDSDSVSPDFEDEEAEFPRDEEGCAWYHDWWQLKQALRGLNSAAATGDEKPAPVEFAIVVEGGVVQDCFCAVPFSYEVFDYDDLQETMSGDEATRHVANGLRKYNSA